MNSLQKILLDPTTMYSIPRDVVADLDLTLDQKIEILRRWQFDANAQDIAEDESGIISIHVSMFDLVLSALHALDEERYTEHS